MEAVFQCYFGHEIERVPVKFGDVRVPFVVRFHEKVAFFFLFLSRLTWEEDFTCIYGVAKH